MWKKNEIVGLIGDIKKAIKDENFKLASDLSIELEEKIEKLRKMYYEYTKNILDF